MALSKRARNVLQSLYGHVPDGPAQIRHSFEISDALKIKGCGRSTLSELQEWAGIAPVPPVDLTKCSQCGGARRNVYALGTDAFGREIPSCKRCWQKACASVKRQSR